MKWVIVAFTRTWCGSVPETTLHGVFGTFDTKEEAAEKQRELVKLGLNSDLFELE